MAFSDSGFFVGVILKDSGGGEASTTVSITKSADGLEICPTGHGVKLSMADEQPGPVWIEYLNGQVTVHVWPDINSEVPHSISLAGARHGRRAENAGDVAVQHMVEELAAANMLPDGRAISVETLSEEPGGRVVEIRHLPGTIELDDVLDLGQLDDGIDLDPIGGEVMDIGATNAYLNASNLRDDIVKVLSAGKVDSDVMAIVHAMFDNYVDSLFPPEDERDIPEEGRYCRPWSNDELFGTDED